MSGYLDNPKISVIVPVYNAAKYLDECVRAIAEQTFTSFEVILLPGNSKDNSTEICEEWVNKDHRIRIVPQDINSVAYARNKGITDAKGDYIAFCDADDLYLPTYLEKMYKDGRYSPLTVIEAVDILKRIIPIFYDADIEHSIAADIIFKDGIINTSYSIAWYDFAGNKIE